MEIQLMQDVNGLLNFATISNSLNVRVSKMSDS